MSIRIESEIMAKWSGKNTPVVSVLCATFNHSSYIRDAIEGFLAQETDFPFEVIIHDDASTDDTAEIVKDYASRFSKIIKPVYQSENQYSKGQRIIGIMLQKAIGKYIAVCEGDDYWRDNRKLQKQVFFLENNPGYCITYHDVISVDKDKKHLSIDFGGSRRDLSCAELINATPIHTLTVVFRNVIAYPPAEWRLAYYGDLFLWSLLGKYGKGKYMDNVSPAFYRVHEHGLHSMTDDKQRDVRTLQTFIALFLYYKRMGEVKIYTQFGLRIVRMLLRQINLRQAFILSAQKLFRPLLWWVKR